MTIDTLEAWGTKEEREQFHALVGQGISAWAALETDIVRVAAILLDTTPAKTGLVLYSIINFNVWLNIIDELFLIDPKFKDGPRKKLRKRWGKIAQKAKELYDTRTRLAHQTLYGPTMLFSISLMPSRLDSRTKSKKTRPLEGNKIAEFTIIGRRSWDSAPTASHGTQLFLPDASQEKSAGLTACWCSPKGIPQCRFPTEYPRPLEPSQA